jgi:hypothetical protein
MQGTAKTISLCDYTGMAYGTRGEIGAVFEWHAFAARNNLDEIQAR